MTTATEDRVPDWLLERLHRGELPEAQAQALRARLARAGALPRLEALAASDGEILASHPPADVAREVRRRHAQAAPKRPASRFLILAPLAAAGAVALALLLIRPAPKSAAPSAGPGAAEPWNPDRPETILLRGEATPVLRLYRRRVDGIQPLDVGTTLRPRDVVQIRYLSARRRFGVVASVDARGTVTLHLPEVSGAAAALEPSGERALPNAFELDETPGFERFVFVTSDGPFSTDAVVQALEAGRRPSAPLSTWEITLRKETP